MPRGFESHRLRQRQHPTGRCFLFLRQTIQGLQGGIRTARARRFASRRAATVLRTVARARENPTACAKYHHSISHWVVIFIASLQNSVAFLINISPLFSSSDFRVRYKSYQQSRQISIHRTTQDFSRSVGTNDSKKAAPDFSDAAAVQITTSLWAALRAVSVCLPSSGRSGSWIANPDVRKCWLWWKYRCAPAILESASSVRPLSATGWRRSALTV